MKSYTSTLPCLTCKKLSRPTLKFLLYVVAIVFTQSVFSQAPTVSSFTPTSAALGNTVIITGTNFDGVTSVLFGGVAASSFTITSSTQIRAVVPVSLSGDITVIKGAFSGAKNGFYYASLSGIITDFGGFWPTTTTDNNSTNPDDSHNLLAFTYNGVTYSTGVNNSTLTGQGINYTAGSFKSLPVANIAGNNTGSSIYLAMASKVDGNAAVANASAVAGYTVGSVLTDGGNGLDMGTGITNLPVSAQMAFNIHIINPERILDQEPDILITQIADPSSGNDVFQFVDNAGNIVGNHITQDMTLPPKLGTYHLDLFNLSPGAPFNSAIGFSTFSTNTTRNIRLVAFKLSDFGINGSNYTSIAALKITPSGTSDYSFIAFNAYAIEMSPNIMQNIDRTNSSICVGGTANLEVITRAAYGGALSYSWEVSTDAGTSWNPVTNGAAYTGATTKRLTITAANHNDRYRATVTEAGTGYSATCSPFTVLIVNPAPPTGVTLSTTAGTTCLNNLVSLSGTVTGGSNIFYEWESNASGAYALVPDALLRTYLPPVNQTGVTSYRLRVSSGSGCGGARTSSPVTITVVGISSVTPASRCGTGIVLMEVTATSGTVRWYDVSSGGTELATGTSYSPSISTSRTYFVSTDASQCATGNRVAVTATINSITWAGTHSADWSNLPNWDCGGTPPPMLPTSTNNVTIPTNPTGGRFPKITTVAPINNITISQGANILVDSCGVFEIYGGIQNYGTLTGTKGTISMRGVSQQTIPGNTFYNNTIRHLTINNPAGVLLGGPLNITGTYTPAAGVLTTFGHLTLKSDVSGTARVAQGSGTYITGNVNVERYVPERRSWRLMTTPLTNANTIYQSWQNGGVYAPGKGLLVTAPGGGTGIDAPGNSSLKVWKTSTQSLLAVNNTKVPISATNKGSADNTGYFIFVRGDREWANIDPNLIRKNITTLTSTGYLQTGTQLFTGLSAVAGGFSLVGNPYASPIDWNLVLSNPGTSNIRRKFYVWDPSLNMVGGYTVMDDVIDPGVFSPTPSSSTQSNFIQSSQALFITTAQAGPASLEIRESNKAAVNNTTIFGRPVGKSEALTINLLLPNNADNSAILADGVRVDFNAGFSAAVDEMDNLKLGNVDESFGLSRNNVLLATERRPSITVTDTLFLKIKKPVKRSYQFQFIPAHFSNQSLLAWLEDSYTRIPTPLSLTATTTVNFTVNSTAASLPENRFRVVFVQAATLPVSFVSVYASRENHDAKIGWEVTHETNVTGYEIWRSADGGNFAKLGFVPAKGNSQAVAHYAFKDHDPGSDKLFYKIKSIDADGSFRYSGVVTIQGIPEKKSIKIFPNPLINRNLKIAFTGQAKGNYSLLLSNAIGQVIFSHQIDHAGTNALHEVLLPSSVKPGSYQAEILNENWEKSVLKIVVN